MLRAQYVRGKDDLGMQRGQGEMMSLHIFDRITMVV